jgi:hypothetical protein
MFRPGASSSKVCAPGRATCQIYARVRLKLVLGPGLVVWQALVHLKPTKRMGPRHLEAHASIARGPDKMPELSLSARHPHNTLPRDVFFTCLFRHQHPFYNSSY